MTSDFCKLGSDLVISYNGSLLECVPKERSSIVGTVLTRGGQLVSRSSRRSHWEVLSTPSVYLFYDNDTGGTFLVDTCKCLIKEIQPEGRILDCTDRIIYEIKCNNWVPICDLSNKIQKTIVLCNTVPATATTASFQFIGRNPVVECFSEISADQVVFCGHTATVTFNASGPGSLPIGGCAVLAFSVCIDDETVTIFKIFIRQAASSQVAAQCANLNGPLTLPVQENTFCGMTTFVATPITPTAGCTSTTAYSIVAGISPTGVLTPVVPAVPPSPLPAIAGNPTPAANSAIIAGNVVDVTGWKIRFNVGFNLIGTDGFQPTIPGNYNINTILSYATDTVIPNSLFTLTNQSPFPAGTTLSVNGGPPMDASTFNFNGVTIVSVPPLSQTVSIPRTIAPRFVLLRGTTTTAGVIEADAPLSGNIPSSGITIASNGTSPNVGVVLPPAIDLNGIGQAVISVGLSLTPTDVLRVAFVDQPGSVTITLPAAFISPIPTGATMCTPVTLVIPIPTPPLIPPFLGSPTVASLLTPLDPVGTTFNATLIG